ESFEGPFPSIFEGIWCIQSFRQHFPNTFPTLVGQRTNQIQFYSVWPLQRNQASPSSLSAGATSKCQATGANSEKMELYTLLIRSQITRAVAAANGICIRSAISRKPRKRRVASPTPYLPAIPARSSSTTFGLK